jgi:hypothetical protein
MDLGQHLPRHDPADGYVFRHLLGLLGHPESLRDRMSVLFSDTRFHAGRSCLVCQICVSLPSRIASRCTANP